MNVSELRAVMEKALQQEGLELQQIVSGAPKAWSLPADDIIRFFQPLAYRRPWGFVYSGSIGIEIPTFRKWLRSNKVGQEGVFHSYFVSYSIVNESSLSNFLVDHDALVPADLWAELIRIRLDRIPTTLSGLITTYQRRKDELGRLAHAHDEHAWEFLLRWYDDPVATLHVPVMQPNGSIV